MSTVDATDSVPAAAVEDDPFYEILHRDPLLLRSEFDDLIAASWGPTEPGDGATGVRPGDGPSRPVRRRHSDDDARATNSSQERYRRIRTDKRSPPAG